MGPVFALRDSAVVFALSRSRGENLKAEGKRVALGECLKRGWLAITITRRITIRISFVHSRELVVNYGCPEKKYY